MLTILSLSKEGDEVGLDELFQNTKVLQIQKYFVLQFDIPLIFGF